MDKTVADAGSWCQDDRRCTPARDGKHFEVDKGKPLHYSFSLACCFSADPRGSRTVPLDGRFAAGNCRGREREGLMVFSSIIFIVGLQVVLLLAVFGWISPLVAGLALRRTPPPRPRPWLITSVVWGGISALIVSGLIVAAFMIQREYGSGFGTGGPIIATEAYSGPTVALLVPDGMTVRMTLGPAGADGEAKAWNFETSGSTLAVPEGAMQIYSLTFSMQDADGVEWRLGSDWNEPSPFTPGQDTPPWMGRLRAGMQVTSSPLTDDLRASLQFADGAGRPYELESPCGKPDNAQQLAMYNAQGVEVWSGRFSFG